MTQQKTEITQQSDQRNSFYEPLFGGAGIKITNKTKDGLALATVIKCGNWALKMTTTF